MFRSLRYTLFPVLNITSPVLMAFAFIMLIPVAVSYLYDDGAERGFLLGAIACLITGIVLKAATFRDRRELLPRDGFLLATILWVALPIFASIPLYTGIPNISFTIALFEAMSGTTTTCATALSGLDHLPQSINFWRCFLSWLGGMGILVLAVAILPLLGVGGSQAFKAEASGPMKETHLTPRIADTAKGLWLIYLAISVLCAASFRWVGMDTFDSIVHAFSTVSLGGFSSHDASFGYWNNQGVETVAIIFMLLCGMSFSLHFFAWKTRSILSYFSNPETLAWLIACTTISLTVATILYLEGIYTDPVTALRAAIFNSVSTIATAGFATQDFNLWPASATTLMFLGACFAPCAGSTGGGVKMMRAIILFKQISSQFKLTRHPNAIVPVTVSGSTVDTPVVLSTLSFMLLWIVLTIVCTWLFMLSGLDMTSSLTAAVSCITNLGPGLGVIGPYSNFSVLSEVQLWLCIFLMLVGRLELVTVFILFTRSFWRF